MPIQDDAQQMISHANDFEQQGMGATNIASDQLNGALQSLQQVKNMATESMSVVTTYLGSDHASLGTVGITANAVSQRAEDANGAIQQALASVMELTQAIASHSNQVGSVGHMLMQGGG